MAIPHIVNIPFGKQCPELTLYSGYCLNGYKSRGSCSLFHTSITVAQGFCILEIALSYWQLDSELEPHFTQMTVKSDSFCYANAINLLELKLNTYPF